jgi:hypothetical protein
MRKIAMLAALCGFAMVVPAQANKPPHPLKPDKTDKPDKPKHKSNPRKCVARSEGYNASGTLVVTGTALTKLADGRYSGTIHVIVGRANHKAATGDQTFTLTDARVKFHKGVDPTNPAPNSRVGLHGKITQLPHSCSTTGFTPLITVRNVDIRSAAKP